MKRLVLLVGLVWLSLVGTTITSQAYYLDTPHNESNGIYCYTCHAIPEMSDLSIDWVQRSKDNPDDTLKNLVCNTCHSETPTNVLKRGPVKKLHASSTTTLLPSWSTECVQCHDVHYQGQLDWSNSDSAKLYLVTGVFNTNGAGALTYTDGNPTVEGDDYTSIGFYDDVVNLKVQPGFEDKTKWKSKGGATASTFNMDPSRATDGSRGLILVPNKNTPAENFEIINVTNNVITVKGRMVRDAVHGGPFAIIYGQSIKSSVMPNGGLVAADLRDVKYFVPNIIPASFGGYVDVSAATGTTKPLGLCQVCHDSTTAWKNDGTANTHNVSDCDSCHDIKTGGSGSANHGAFIGDRLTGTACLSCHTAFNKPESAHSGSCDTCHTAVRPAINSNYLPNEGTAPGPTVYDALDNGVYSFDVTSGRLKDADGDTIAAGTSFLMIDCGECHELKRAALAAVPPTHGGHSSTHFAWTTASRNSCGGGVAGTSCHMAATNTNVVGQVHGGTCTLCHSSALGSSINEKIGDSGFGIDGDATTASGRAALGTLGTVDCLVCHSAGGNNNFTSLGGIHHVNKASNTNCTTSNCHTAAKLTHTSTVVTDSNCNSCHDAVAANGNARDAITAPFIGTGEIHLAKGGCTACHVIAAAPGSAGSLKTVAGITLSYGPTSTPTYTNGTDGGGNCTACHGAYFVNHLNQATLHTTQVTNSCSSCHTSTVVGVARKATTTPYVGGGEVHATCFTCHQANGLMLQSPAKAPGQNTITFDGGSCNTCHVYGAVTWTTLHTGPVAISHNTKVTNAPACQTCHAATQPAGSTARRATTIPYSTAATGEVHSNLGCATCHNATSGAKLTTFASGHAQANVAGACTGCHTLAWDAMHTPATVNHATSKVTATSTCTACHTTATTSPYIGAGLHAACSTCHNADGSNKTASLVKADNVPVGGGACVTCHTITSTWSTIHDGALGINHSTEVANQTECTSCHSATGGFGAGQIASLVDGVSGNKVHNACLDCHNADGTRKVVTASGGSAPIPANGGACNVCHGTNYFNTHAHHNGANNQVLYNATIDRSQLSNIAANACAECHYDLTGNNTSFDTWDGIRREHDIWDGAKDTTGGCETCHNYTVLGEKTGAAGTPVASVVATVIATNATANCTTCHVPKLWSNATSAHGGHSADFVKTATCTTGCHTNASVWNNDMHTCVMCHAGGVTSRTTITSGNTLNGIDGDARMAAGAAPSSWLSFNCLSCHTPGTTIPTGAPTGAGTTNAINASSVGGIHHDNKTNGVVTNLTCATAGCHTAAKLTHTSTVATDTNCNSCHDAVALNGNARDAINAPFIATGEVHLAKGGCSACHVIAATPGSAGSLKSVPGITLSYGPTSSPTYSNGIDGGGNCTGCHGAYFANHLNAATLHTTQVTNNCSGCHTTPQVGAARPAVTVPYTGAGQVHATAGCFTCHEVSTGLMRVSPLKAPGQNTATFNGGNCSACHIAGTTTWTTIHSSVSHAGKVTTNTNCTSCHTGTTPGASTLAKDALTSPFIGSGEVHNLNGCATCHNATTGATLAPFGRAVAITGGGDCSTCHIDATKTWAVRHSATVTITTNEHTDLIPTASCVTCHGNPTPETSNARDAKVVPYIVAGDVHATGCALCHDTTTGARISGANGKGSAAVAAVGGQWTCAVCHTTLWEPAHTAAVGVDHTDRASLGTTTCATCHTNTAGGANGLMPVNASDNKVHDACSVCHDTATGGLKVGNTVNGQLPIAKGYCNTCHGDSYFSNTATSKHSSSNHSVTVGADLSGGAACFTCHSADTGTTPGNNWALILARHDKSITNTDVCKVCHDATRISNANAAIVADRTLTVQQIITKYSPTATPVTCLMCHDKAASHGTHATTDFAAGASTECTGCHVIPAAGVVAGLHKDNCLNCHESMAGGLIPTASNLASTVNGVDGDSRNGRVALIPLRTNVTCLTCHPVANYPTGAIHHNSTPLKPNCVDCHTPGNVTHGGNHSLAVSGTTNCSTACHATADVVGTTGGIKVDPANAKVHDACLTCHINTGGSGLLLKSSYNYNRVDGKIISVTMPTARGTNTCNTCHGTYFGNHGRASHTSQVQTLAACSSCHTDLSIVGTSTTVPVDPANPKVHDACTTCHDANTGAANAPVPGKAPARPAGGGDCAACHTTIYFAGHTHHTTATSVKLNTATTGAANCTTSLCHNTTSIASPYIGTNLHLGCTSCHSATNGTVITTGSLTGKIAPYGECNYCHDSYFTGHKTHTATTHAITQRVGTDLSNGAACNTCHGSFANTAAGILALHSGGCTMCHNETRTLNTEGSVGIQAIIQNDSITIGCLTCHTDRSAAHAGHPVDFQAPPAACSGCHTGNVLTNIHGNGTTATCTICHTGSGSPSAANVGLGSATSGVDGNAANAAGIATANTWSTTGCLVCHPTTTYPTKGIHHDTANALAGMCQACHTNTKVNTANAPTQLACLMCHVNINAADTGVKIYSLRLGNAMGTRPTKLLKINATEAVDGITTDANGVVTSHTFTNATKINIYDMRMCFSCHDGTFTGAKAITPFHGFPGDLKYESIIGSPVGAANIATNGVYTRKTMLNGGTNTGTMAINELIGNNLPLVFQYYHPGHQKLRRFSTPDTTAGWSKTFVITQRPGKNAAPGNSYLYYGLSDAAKSVFATSNNTLLGTPRNFFEGGTAFTAGTNPLLQPGGELLTGGGSVTNTALAGMTVATFAGTAKVTGSGSQWQNKGFNSTTNSFTVPYTRFNTAAKPAGMALGQPKVAGYTIVPYLTAIAAPGAQLSWKTTSATVSEGVGTVVLTASRKVGSALAVGATVTATGTASNGAALDYTFTPTSLSWAANDMTNKTVTITINNDATVEALETIIMTLTAPTGTGTTITGTAVTTSIADNDGTTDTTGPTDGTITSIVPAATSLTLNWTAATDASGLRATTPYDVRFLAGATAPTCSTGTSIYTGTALTYAHTGLTTGSTYSYRVCAYDTLNNVSTGITTSGVPVAPDTVAPVVGTVSVTPISGTFITANPTISATLTEAHANSTVASCQYTTDNTNWFAGVVTNLTATTWNCTGSPTGLTTGAKSINVRGTNNFGYTGTGTLVSRTVDLTAPTVSVLTVTPGDSQNSLSWTASTDTGGSGLRTTNTYDVRYGVAPTCTTGTSAYTGTLLFFNHLGLKNGDQYDYVVCAYDNLNNVSTSVMKSGTPYSVVDTTPPVQTGTLTATAASSTQINLSWLSATDAGSGMHATTPYKVVRAAGATAPADCTGTAIYTGTAITFNNTGLTASTQYSYRVCAYDVAGNVSAGLVATQTTATPDTTPPVQTGSLTATAASSTQIDLSWLAATDAGDGMNATTPYKVVGQAGATAPANCTGTAIYTGTALSYSVTGLTASTQYSYRVCAYDANNNVSAGLVATQTTATPDTTPPVQTGSLTATAASSTQINLSWLAATDAGSGMHATTPYKVVRAAGATAPADCTGTAIYTGTAITFNNTGLTASTQYSYRVCAYDVAGNVSAGLVATQTTPAVADTTPPVQTGTLGAAVASATSVALSWSAATDAGSGMHATTPYKLVRATGATAPADCTGTAIYTGTLLTFTNTGLTSGTTYSYRLCAYDVLGNVSTGLTASATPVAPTNVTYYITPGTATAVGVDGSTNYTADQPADAPPIMSMLGSATANTTFSYRPTSGMVNGTWATLMKTYSQVYATAKSITAGSTTSFTVRGYNANDEWRCNIYAYDPAGAAGNKTLVLTSSVVVTPTAGTTATITPTYTGSGTIPAGYRLLMELDYRPVGSVYTPRVYNTTSTFTVTQQ